MIILISSLPYYTGLPKPVLRGQISNKNNLKFMLGNIVKDPTDFIESFREVRLNWDDENEICSIIDERKDKRNYICLWQSQTLLTYMP